MTTMTALTIMLHCYGPQPKPRIAAVLAGTTPDFLLRGSPAAIPHCLWQEVIVGA